MALDLTNAKLTFSDEFNSFSWNPDASSSITKDTTNNGTWATHYWWGGGDRTLSGNAEQEYYADASTALVQQYPWTNPFSVQDGVLTIKAQASPNTALSGGLPYVSGMITTEGTFSQTYGYFEMRADLPTGQGIWPAFWMLNQAHTWPPELDIVEMIGSRPYMLEMTAHTGIGGHSTAGMNKGVDVGDMTTGMHSYGAMVMPDRITWYFDGREMFSCATPDDLKQPLYMIANVAVGGHWPGSPNSTTPWPAEMKIDYIKAWQMPGTPGYDSAVSVGGTTTTPPPPSSNTQTPAPVTTTVGTGSDSLVLKVSQDAWQGNAQYTVSVDGVQVGGTLAAGALRGSGQTDTVTVKGDWGVGTHTVAVNFLNDAYGGSASADRNLYIEGATYDGATVPGAARSLLSSGAGTFTVADTTAVGGAATGAVTKTVGSGADSLVLKISQDAWQGSAQYTVKVDGQQVGGTLTAGALHGSGQSDTVTVKGDWAAGTHNVTVEFLNDAYGGSATTDRNLYIESASYDGAAVPGAARTLWSAGASSFSVTDTAAAGGTGGTGGSTTVGTGGSDRIVVKVSEEAWNGDAQFTVSVDGVQQGGVMTARSLFGSGASDSITIQGDWDAGSHSVAVNFLNDAYGGSAATDRNLHVDGITWNGAAVAGTPATLWSTGAKTFAATDSTAAPAGHHAPAALTIGTGADKLFVKISEDAWQGDAQYRIKVDGAQIGDLLSAKALHGAGSDVVTVQGDWAAGTHKLSVEFVNDLYGGSASTDRNLYVDGISFDDAAVAGGAVAVAGGTATLWSAGTHDFWFS